MAEPGRIAVIKELCRKKEDYVTAFKEILKIIKGEREKPDQFGFSMYDIRGMSVHLLSRLRQDQILKCTYESNKGKWFWLADDLPVEDIERAIEEVEKEQCEKEQIELQPFTSETLLPYNVEWLEKWEQMLRDGVDMLEYWSKQINPKVIGLEYVKQVVLLSLASAGDKYGDRGRIHVLMYGDPGTAKSAIGGWLVHTLGIIGASHRTSDVGLTGDARGDTITPGILPVANERAVYIDELDKFSEKDRYGLLESMEEGEVIIHAGKTHVRLPARCRVIAGANSIKDFAPELLDRFDFKVDLKIPGIDEEKEIIAQIVEAWREAKEGYYGEELRAYLDWIKSYEPKIPDEVRKMIAILIQAFIDMNEAVRGSIRKKESIVRVAYTIAKLNRRAMKAEDMLHAIRLLYPTINGGQVTILQTLMGMVR